MNYLYQKKGREVGVGSVIRIFSCVELNDPLI